MGTKEDKSATQTLRPASSQKNIFAMPCFGLLEEGFQSKVLYLQSYKS